MCASIERLPDPPKGVRHVPATLKWMEGNVEVSRTIRHEDNNTVVMVPEFDPLLEDFVARHSHQRPEIETMNYIKTFEVDQATWDNADVVGQFKKELAGITGAFFEESEHYKDEAVKCYNAHGNPDIHSRCPDFRDSSKLIGPQGDKVPPKYQVHLCVMCPYMQSHLATEMRWKAGLYDGQKVALRRKAAAARRRRRRR